MQRHIEAVVFDMDGTLTRPVLDFDAIRAEIGLPEGPILESVARLTGAARGRAEAILMRHEAHAAARSELQNGAAEVVRAIRAAGARLALMTRNSRCSADTVLARHGMRFDVVWTREDGPVKPSPEPVFRICERLGVGAQRTCVVGDYLFDIQCGRAAGATTVLLHTTGPLPSWAPQADFVVAELRGLLDCLRLRPAATGAAARD